MNQPIVSKYNIRTRTALLFGAAALVFIAFCMYGAFGAGSTDNVSGLLTVARVCVFTTNADSSGITFAGSAGLDPGQNTIGTVNSISVTDTGNLGSNILISASNWVFGTNTFYVTNTIYNAILQPYYVAPYVTGATTDTFIPVNTAAPNSISFGVAAPVGVPPGTYAQTINIISNC